MYVHITFVGDAGTITRFNMNANTKFTYLPAWPNKPVVNNTPYVITFWESKAKWEENFWKGAGFAVLGSLLSSSTTTGMDYFSALYDSIGKDLLTDTFSGKGVKAVCTNVFYQSGWAIYQGGGWGCDVGNTPTRVQDPVERDFGYMIQTSRDGVQSNVYYPGEEARMIEQSQVSSGRNAARGTNGITGWTVVRVLATHNVAWAQVANKVWAERANWKETRRFTEVQRDEWSVYISDTRGVELRIDLYQQAVYYSDRTNKTPVRYLSIVESWKAPA